MEFGPDRPLLDADYQRRNLLLVIMNPDQFVMWLHGYFEIENPQYLDESQTALIKKKLESLFVKVTPDRNPRPMSAKGYDLNETPGPSPSKPINVC